MDYNKVSVKIYGQEYTIAGEASREHIMKVADYVDTKMHEIAKAAPGTAPASLAVLSAVNMADEYFAILAENEELIRSKEQNEKDAAHYVELWDEAKRNVMQYKEEYSNMQNQKEELMRNLSKKELEIRELEDAVNSTAEKVRKDASKEIEELKAKIKELENSFFDLQMENIRLKEKR